MNRIVLVILPVLIISFSCVSDRSHLLSEIKYEFNNGDEIFEMKSNSGCLGITKRINFQISHEKFNLTELKKVKLKISWQDPIYFGEIRNNIDVDVPFCKEYLDCSIFTFSIFDETDSLIYIWSKKNPVELWNIDSMDITLLGNGSYLMN